MDLSVPDNLPPELQHQVRYKNLIPGQALFQDRDPAESIFALKVGRIRLVRYTHEGNLVLFRIVRPGESFAQSALFTETYPCNAVVDMPSCAICYPKTVVWEVLHKKPDLALTFLQDFNRENLSLKKLLELRSIRSARNRLLEYFQFSISSGQQKIVFDRPYKDIASELGLTSETLYRSLADLEESGVISRQGREVELLISQT